MRTGRIFGLDLVREIRKRVGDSYPIMYRIDLSLALNETYKERMETVRSLKKFTNGRTIYDTLRYMENLVKAGLDMFDVDLGCYDNWCCPIPRQECLQAASWIFPGSQKNISRPGK